MTSAAVITRPTFTLADRLRIQCDRRRDRDYIIVGRLTSVVFEGQREISGLSQARTPYFNSAQQKLLADQPGLQPMNDRQKALWASISLDWLTNKNAPVLAISRDRQDLLLPQGLTPLPPIPDPRWVPKTAGDTVKRIPQLLTGCPVVGDRVRDKITARDGRVYGVVHPIRELCFMLAGAQGGFGRIRGLVDPTDGTHLALLLDDSGDPMQGYFVGGKFSLGG